MSSSLVHIVIAIAFLFPAAHAQWVHCGPEFGHPTLRNCNAALDAMAAVPHPATPFLVGPHHALEVPDIYLPFSIQVADCLIVINGTAADMLSWAELTTMADFAVSGIPHGCVAGQGTGGIAKFAEHDPIFATITGISPQTFQIPLELPSDPNSHRNPNPNPNPEDQAFCRLQPHGSCDSGSSCKTKAYDNMEQCESALRSCKSDAGPMGPTCVLRTGRGKGGRATQRRRRSVLTR